MLALLPAELLPWVQLVAIGVAAVAAIASIRSTTHELAVEIKHLANAVEKLETKLDGITATIMQHESRLAVLEQHNNLLELHNARRPLS